MFRLLFLLFVTVPLLEIYLLIQIGSRIGALYTVGLVILTAILGVALLRLQGLITLARVRQSLDQGRIPAVTLVEGLVLLVAGALLLTPGFFTDALGFLCLVPAFRTRLAKAILKRLIEKRPPPDDGPGPGPATVDAEYWEVEKSERLDNH